VYFPVQYDGVQWRWSLYCQRSLKTVGYGKLTIIRGLSRTPTAIWPGDDVFATSPPYDSQTDAHEAIRQVKIAAGGACTRLRQAPTRAGRWYWHLKSRNGKVLVRGEGYVQEADVACVITLMHWSMPARRLGPRHPSVRRQQPRSHATCATSIARGRSLPDG
jgi:uncharacterized protein YegP (UPF0339 family)